ncbi:MAG: hypothetical protein ACI8XZ_004934 [Gammaproteobacteria bacterium]|jgi:hypothetical protein
MRHVQIKLWMIPTCSAPTSFQQKSQFLRLCKCLHNRKAWLFSQSVAGVKASANLYSLIETAKAHSLEPYAFLREVFTKLPLATTIDDIEALRPGNIDAQQINPR